MSYSPTAAERPEVAEIQLDDLARLPDLIARLAAEGVRLTRVEPHDPTLEDLYFAVRKDHRERLAAAGRGDDGLAPVVLPDRPAPPRNRIDLAQEDRR